MIQLNMMFGIVNEKLMKSRKININKLLYMYNYKIDMPLFQNMFKLF